MLDPRLQSDTLTAYEGTQLPSLKAHVGEALKETLSREAKAGIAKSVTTPLLPQVPTATSASPTFTTQCESVMPCFP
jgi:hypothetical protein